MTNNQSLFNQSEPMTEPKPTPKPEPKVAKPRAKVTTKKPAPKVEPKPKPKPKPEMTHINQVITRVMQETGAQVGKDGTNKHFKFKYVSIDKILTHLRETMSKHNLVFFMDEQSFDIIERDQAPPLAIVKYACWMEWNDQSTKPEALTQTAVLQKEQSIGALRSYVQKYWLRTKFMLALGEEDLDAEGNTISNGKSAPQESAETKQQHALFHRRNAITSGLTELGLGGNMPTAINWILGSFNPETHDLATLDERQIGIVERFIMLTKKAPPEVKSEIPKTAGHAIQHTISTKDWLQTNNLL